ncbi:hypothetical protein [Endozoicomonas euniceicola]|uniref:WG repeat-containing protein n=1 Tax=Endozoicomonas euniceicola TaxID=1234143 RepID=A0ABY6GUE4_9GAMM|nr:hypothetical protein [Endozoicomonas euniceicola]UYM16187.1 hypothetical protein NX720_25890 [Endozoicomonas euniceicola]
MTAQISSGLVIDDESYTIIGSSSGSLFDPRSLGIEPKFFSSCCLKGYISSVVCKNDQLFLKSLTIGLPFNQPAPLINGVVALDQQGELYFGHHYNDVWLPLKYSGEVELGKDWHGNLGRGNHGFAPAVEFESVYQCVFEQGKLIKMIDISDSYIADRQQLIAKVEQESAKRYKQEQREKRRKLFWLKCKAFVTGKKIPATLPDEY